MRKIQFYNSVLLLVGKKVIIDKTRKFDLNEQYQIQATVGEEEILCGDGFPYCSGLRADVGIFDKTINSELSEYDISFTKSFPRKNDLDFWEQIKKMTPQQIINYFGGKEKEKAINLFGKVYYYISKNKPVPKELQQLIVAIACEETKEFQNGSKKR